MNNKGIILSTYVYMLLIFFLLVLGTLLVVLNNTKILSKKINTKEEFSIVLLGNKEIELIVGDTFTDPGYIAQTIDGTQLTATVNSNLDSNTEGTYTITYTVKVGRIIQTVTRTINVIERIFSFNYTGKNEMFEVPLTGYYKLEVWGAQGGYAYNETSYRGGYGSYSKGIVQLGESTVLFINIGGKGNNSTTKSSTVVTGGYNGGGNGFGYTDKYTGAGGGATHIATSSGLLSVLSSGSSSILIVAGGGGGAGYESATYTGIGGNGGGILGVSGGYSSGSFGAGGSQAAGGSGIIAGSFGKGASSTGNGTGGGGGYYGGGSGQYYRGGGGGSGYIGNLISGTRSMYTYCTSSCTSYESTVDTTKTTTGSCVNAIATEDCAKSGDGYAKITYVGTTLP